MSLPRRRAGYSGNACTECDGVGGYTESSSRITPSCRKPSPLPFLVQTPTLGATSPGPTGSPPPAGAGPGGQAVGSAQVPQSDAQRPASPGDASSGTARPKSGGAGIPRDANDPARSSTSSWAPYVAFVAGVAGLVIFIAVVVAIRRGRAQAPPSPRSAASNGGQSSSAVVPVVPQPVGPHIYALQPFAPPPVASRAFARAESVATSMTAMQPLAVAGAELDAGAVPAGSLLDTTVAAAHIGAQPSDAQPIEGDSDLLQTAAPAVSEPVAAGEGAGEHVSAARRVQPSISQAERTPQVVFGGLDDDSEYSESAASGDDE